MPYDSGETGSSEENARSAARQEGIMTASSDSGKRGLIVKIDPNRCIANAACTIAAPGVYALDEETGIAELLHEDDASLEAIFAGARACPTQAIIIEQFGRRVFPQILPPMWGDKQEPDPS
jgi:ferredoxin